MQQQTISQSPDFAGSGAERRIDLDWVRIAAFGLLIFYHVGMLYVSWGFHIKSAHRLTALEPLMLVLNPWRLSLLFLVSGVATRFMLRKYAVLPLLRSRTARLLIPLVFGMLVIVPPQAYDQIVESLGYPAGFIDFYFNHYFAFGPQFCPSPCILLPTWNHLWFVAYLWVYTMALGVLVMAVPGLVGWIERWLAPVLSGVLLLVVPSLVFAVYRLILLPCKRISARFSARPRQAILGWHRASALDRLVARGGVLPVVPRVAIDAGRRTACENLCRNCLRLLSMALHDRRARLCPTLDHERLEATPLSHRCNLSLLHRASDRDHHDRARAARQRSFRLAGSEHRDCRHRRDLRAHLRDRAAHPAPETAVRIEAGHFRTGHADAPQQPAYGLIGGVPTARESAI